MARNFRTNRVSGETFQRLALFNASTARVAANNDERGGRGIESSNAPVAVALTFGSGVRGGGAD